MTTDLDKLVRHVMTENLPPEYEFTCWESRAFYREYRKVAWPACTQFTLLVKLAGSPVEDWCINRMGSAADLIAHFDNWRNSLADRRALVLESPVANHMEAVNQS